MKRREDAPGTRVERTDPHAIGRAASESERPPATAPMSNTHGTRVHRVGSAKPPAQKLDAIHPRPALCFSRYGATRRTHAQRKEQCRSDARNLNKLSATRRALQS